MTGPEQPFSRIHEFACSSLKAALNKITVRYAQALPKIKFNIATPGEIANRKFAATDMNDHTGELTVTEGTDSIVKLAMIGIDGPTGTFADRLGPVAWPRNQPAVDAAEPNSDIEVQVRKGHRMFLASVIEPHTSMSTINLRSFRYVGVC